MKDSRTASEQWADVRHELAETWRAWTAEDFHAAVIVLAFLLGVIVGLLV